MDTRSIKTVLIDDEEKSLKNLKRLLDLYCKEVKIVGDASDVESGMDIILETRPDLVFLDVEMSDGSGFHLLERLKECSFHVIFVTAHSHYAIKAFRFEATDYLLKPIDIDELIQAVKKVQQKEGGFEKARPAADVKQSYLELKTVKGFTLVNLKEITRLEGEGSYTYVHLSDGDKHVLSYHLGYFEPRLNDDFFRVHKSHIINLQFIHRVHRTDGLIVEMRDGAHIEVSRRLKGSFLERIKGGSATL